MGPQPANNVLVAGLRDELAGARAYFPSAGELIVKGGLYISADRAEHMRSRIAPLVRRFNSDEARAALGEARQLAALGECFVYLHWVLQAVGAPSAVFRGYAHHYLTSAISLLEDRTDDGPRDAAKGRAQAWQADIEFLRSLLNTYLDMPVHLINDTAYLLRRAECNRIVLYAVRNFIQLIFIFTDDIIIIKIFRKNIVFVPLSQGITDFSFLLIKAHAIHLPDCTFIMLPFTKRRHKINRAQGVINNRLFPFIRIRRNAPNRHRIDLLIFKPPPYFLRVFSLVRNNAVIDFPRLFIE